MHKIALMLMLTGFGSLGCLVWGPFCGILIYYLFATLRPQFIWEYTLPEGIPWSQLVAMGAMGSLFVWRMAVTFAPRRHRFEVFPKWNIGHSAMAFFAFWIWMTYENAFSKVTAQPFFEEYKKIFIMYFVAALGITSIRQMWTLYITLMLMLAYIGYEINEIYFLNGGYLFVYWKGYGGLDNNGAALMLAMGVPLCIFAWDAVTKWYRWIYLAFVPIILHAVMTSYSRGAMLSLLLTLPIYLVRIRSRKQFGVLLMIVAMMIPVLAGKEIRDRFMTINKSESDGSAQSRLTSWGIAWRMANERPFFGFGVRNSNLFTFSYGADMEGRTIHSQYLQIAADSGLVGMGAYCFALAAAAICLWRVRQNIPGHVGFVNSFLNASGYLYLRRWRGPPTIPRDGSDASLTYSMAAGLECSMAVFCIGAIFLSLENFELPYILLLMCAQLAAVQRIQHPASYASIAPQREVVTTPI
jgi:probable O-glycosylation ligase (exosortase A-associated)